MCTNIGDECNTIEDMHFVWFSMWDGFFSPRVSRIPPESLATTVGFRDEWWEIHLAQTIQKAFSRIFYTLRQSAKFTGQSCRLWKPCELYFSHNCYLHGGRSEICDNSVTYLVMDLYDERSKRYTKAIYAVRGHYI